MTPRTTCRVSSPGVLLGSLVRMVCVLTAVCWATRPILAQPGESPAATPAASRPVEAETPVARDPRFDSETGRDRRVWPTDPVFQHHQFTLELVMPDMTKPEFSATATLVLSPIAEQQTTVVLDAGPGLTFSTVRVDGVNTTFRHDGEAQTITIDLPRPVPPGRKVTLVMSYTANKPGGRGSGLTLSGDDRRTPEVDPMLHTQGEPQSNHKWFPCHDFPNLRVPTEIIATVPEPFEAISNGKLLSVTRRSYASLGLVPPEPVVPSSSDSKSPQPAEPSPTHLRTFHWRQELPHPYYLVCLVVGRFGVANLGGPESSMPGLPIQVYGPLGSEEQLRRAFANTPEMIAYFSKLFDYPYPWDKYTQVLCRDFTAGAMENTSIVTFNASLARGGGRSGTIDEIIAHELVHHWFGDLVTCKSWEHLWLNEGWASMGEALWAEKVRGDDGYQATMLQFVRRERASSSGRTTPKRAGMVSNLYRNPDSRFTSGDNVYSKGAVVLHMLRMRLGDEMFFAGARNYLKRHAFGHVETDDFRLALEEVSGQSLERFFTQWCARPGHPSLEIDLDFVPADAKQEQKSEHEPGSLTVTLEQTQTIDADNPAFAFVLPIWVRFNENDGQYVYISTDQRTVTQTFTLPRRPVDVEVDPNLTVLCRSKVRQPLVAARWQAEHGSTFAARQLALDQLATMPEAHGQTLTIGTGGDQ